MCESAKNLTRLNSFLIRFSLLTLHFGSGLYPCTSDDKEDLTSPSGHLSRFLRPPCEKFVLHRRLSTEKKTNIFKFNLSCC